MFNNEQLKTHLETSPTIKTSAKIIAEFNTALIGNIEKYGCYKYEPSNPASAFNSLSTSYSSTDTVLYSNNTIFEELNNAGKTQEPYGLTSNDKKFSNYYSLEQCFKQFRPRSGINKLFYLGGNQYLDNFRSVNRPRYYIASKKDNFKYWTSFKKDSVNNKFTGISSNEQDDNGYAIDNAVPFVTYTEPVPANRIVVKMQTGIGDPIESLKVVFGPAGVVKIDDPLADRANSSIPSQWKIQYLVDNGFTKQWQDAITFNPGDTRSDGSPIVASDGYVEVVYGLLAPIGFENNFLYFGSIVSTPASNGTYVGESYLNKFTDIVYTWDGEVWVESESRYGFKLLEDADPSEVYLEKIVNPETYEDGFREFINIYGIRVAVQAMENPSKPFELIEMSPRLNVDLSNSTMAFSVDKKLSDDSNGLPVGTISADSGSITLFNGDMAFSEFNALDLETKKGSVVAKYLRANTKISFYEVIDGPFTQPISVPIKSLYVESFPSSTSPQEDITLSLRDQLFRLENEKGPDILLTDASLTYAVAVLLDSIGFTNYAFVGFDDDNNFKIPYFFMSSELNIAQILEKLAVASQSCIFFNEENTLVVMSKDYLDPENRQVDMEFVGTNNASTLPNIMNISSSDKLVFNDGVIKYNERYIQRAAKNLSQASNIDFAKQYVYKPTLLWEVSGSESMKASNGEGSQQQGYALSAMALQSDLTNEVPVVVNGQITKNVIDVGENIYYVARYNGYFYLGTEIIKYDAVEFTVTYIEQSVGTVTKNIWISSNEEYQRYFGKMAFNARMFPTGAIRIFAEPRYDATGKIINGAVKSHGRGQFNTVISNHYAGLRSYWTDQENSGNIDMASEYLFNQFAYPLAYLTSQENKELFNAGVATDNVVLDKSLVPVKRNDITKPRVFGQTINMFAQKYLQEIKNIDLINRMNRVQTSALILGGPAIGSKPRDVISYTKIKNSDAIANNLSSVYGTRMRIFGEIEDGRQRSQTTSGGIDYFQNIQLLNQDGGTIADRPLTISGAGGGLGIFVDETKGSGYFFEISALSSSDLSRFTDSGEPVYRENPNDPNGNKIDYREYYSYRATHNIVFYKTVPGRIQQRSKILTAAGSGSTLTIWLPGTQVSIGTKITIADFVNKGIAYSQWNGEYTVQSFAFDPAVQAFSHTLVKTSGTGPTFNTANFDLDFAATSFSGYIYNNITSVSSVLNQVGETTIAVNNGASLFVGDSVRIRSVTNQAAMYGTVTAFDGVNLTVNVTSAEGQGRFSNWTVSVKTDLSPKAFYDAGVKNVPVKLWGKTGNILVDNGMFINSSRALNPENATVYDLSVEFSGTFEKPSFNLYINNKLVGIVQDTEPISSIYSSVSSLEDLKNTSTVLFTRGTSTCIFENFYQVANNSTESQLQANPFFSSVIETDEQSTGLSVQNYSISPFLQEAMRGISTQTFPKYSVYFEEFGALARECGYFNIRFDQAYPALKSKIYPVTVGQKVYTTSNYYADAYGAEFLIFNITDGPVTLDEVTNNWLRILGITFTQNGTRELTLSDYIDKNSGIKAKFYSNIQSSREKNGTRSFTIDSEYIQNNETATKMMDWIINKTVNPKLQVGASVFSMPHLNLGDVVTINLPYQQMRESYTGTRENINFVDTSKKFIVYGINYSRDANGPGMSVRLVEA